MMFKAMTASREDMMRALAVATFLSCVLFVLWISI